LLQDLAVSAFLDELASSSPAPGGGSVAALAGAMAAALVSMVCNLTIGNDKYREAEAVMRETLTQAEQLRMRLTELMEKDTNAYSAVIASYKLPKDSDEQKAARTAAIQAALKQAVEVPLATAEAAVPLRALARTAKEHGNPNAASDAYVSEMLATTAINAALANADINLPSIKDADFVAAARARIDALGRLKSKD
jgi:methenyltetrahydrofolate cyclohydrolase